MTAVELTHSETALLVLMAEIQEKLPEHTSKAVIRRASELQTKGEKRQYLTRVLEEFERGRK